MAGKKKQAQLTPEEKLQQALVPKAEQPYKVPANWCWVKAGIVTNIFNGNSINEKIKAEKYYGKKEGLIFIATKDIGFDNVVNYETNVKITDYQNFKIAPANTALLCIEGGSSGRKVGFVDQNVCFGNKLCAFASNIINSKFIYYILQSQCFYDQFNNKRHGLIGGVSIKDLAEMYFMIPPLAEQQRIVERIESLFAKLDEAKENLQNVLDGFETRKAAILHKAFTGELTANWRKQHGVSMESWVITTLKDVCLKITDGTHNSPVNTPIGEYMYITAKNIKETGVDLSNITFVSKDVHNEIYSRCDVQYGDVLYIKDGATTGIATVNNIEIPFSLLSSVAVLRPNKKIILAKYMAYNLNSSEVKSMMINNMSGNAITRLTLTKIKAAIIKICSLEEQAEIVRIIDDLLAKELQAKELAENALAKIDLIKKSILARAFRGELSTNNLADEPAVELLKRML